MGSFRVLSPEISSRGPEIVQRLPAAIPNWIPGPAWSKHHCVGVWIPWSSAEFEPEDLSTATVLNIPGTTGPNSTVSSNPWVEPPALLTESLGGSQTS